MYIIPCIGGHMKQNKSHEILKILDRNSYVFEHNQVPEFRKRTGSYYTSLNLTLPMAKELIQSLPKEKRSNLHKLKFLEPCVGTGNFVFAYIVAATEYIARSDMRELLDNIYVCDINNAALEEYKNNLRSLANSEFNIFLEDVYFENQVRGGILFDVTQNQPKYVSINNVFPNLAENSFDIVMTNPPYKNLKAELGHYASEERKIEDKLKYEFIARTAKKELPLSSFGTLNLYKLFVEEILTKYAKSDALVSLLIPTSILTDKTCEKIREKIITDYHVVSLKNINENNRFIDAQQALTAILIDKNQSNTIRSTSICKSYQAEDDSPAMVNLSDLATKDNGYSILLLNQQELDIVKEMSKFPKIKDLPFIINLRGELDLTANKKSITTETTKYGLRRGRNIGHYRLVRSITQEYVEPEFVAGTAKNIYIHNERLACQQISNIAKERRLTFAKIAPGTVLANSCNFIAVRENEHRIDINYLAGLLNSKLMNWFFKIHSSNNHINNYEVGNFPIPIKGAEIKKISALVRSMDEYAENNELLDDIENLIADLFNMTNPSVATGRQGLIYGADKFTTEAYAALKYIIPDLLTADVEALLEEQQTIEATVLKYNPSLSKFDVNVVAGIVDKYKRLANGKILNHTTFKLSDLDMEMITPIPQGGNWKDIPTETVNKSRRLQRITETGGRTTLYGRLHYQKPSYTITTYFNRPGNGTYVHPVHNRVLSVREAARFQAFSDDYYFFGNKTQLLKQIGNAVPTLLAYQIGRKIINRLGAAKSLDLFCGAGGLTAGLKDAGIETVLCTDNDVAACTTIKINNPEAQVICGDITNDEVRSLVTARALKSGADIVCGGPPCQGFSMAGYRDKNDPRNQLFKEFVAVVEKSRPKIVLFENVEGILTFNGGETYDAIHELFSELGYKTEGRLLKIDRFGVPQKRKRVIIICTRFDTGIDPAELYPDEITIDDDEKITAADTIADLEQVPCSDNAVYNPVSVLSHYNKLLKRQMTQDDFLTNITSKKSSQLELAI
jgi:DNA-cytosine methyltransferase